MTTCGSWLLVRNIKRLTKQTEILMKRVLTFIRWGEQELVDLTPSKRCGGVEYGYLSMIGFWKIVTVRITTNCQASDYFGRSRGSARYQRDQSALIVARSYQKHACAILVDYVIFSDIPKLLCFVCPSFVQFQEVFL